LRLLRHQRRIITNPEPSAFPRRAACFPPISILFSQAVLPALLARQWLQPKAWGIGPSP
jgi:hypothetical protein